MSLTPREVYERVLTGTTISDPDLVEGVLFYKDLSTKMNQMGPVFKLAAREIDKTLDTLTFYARNRDIMP